MGQWLALVIQLCTITGTTTPASSVDFYQLKCQKYYVECMARDDRDLAECISERPYPL